MANFYISDLHIGHENILRFDNRPFADVNEMQFIFVTFGGNVLSVESLSPMSWLICVVLAFLVVPIDMIRKAFTKKSKE